MKRLALLLACCAVTAFAVRGPVSRLVCPETITAYARMPRPSVPVVAGTYLAEVGDRFAVGGLYDPMPAGQPRLGGDPSAVRHEHAETWPTGERCGRVVAGYRYHIYVAEHAGDVVIDGHPVQISARP